MRKLLHEVQDIDQYILQEMTAADKLVFQARMLTTGDLQEKVQYQLQAHQLIRRFARNAQREKLETVYACLWEDPAFRMEITSIFK